MNRQSPVTFVKVQVQQEANYEKKTPDAQIVGFYQFALLAITLCYFQAVFHLTDSRNSPKDKDEGKNRLAQLLNVFCPVHTTDSYQLAELSIPCDICELVHVISQVVQKFGNERHFVYHYLLYHFFLWDLEI